MAGYTSTIGGLIAGVVIIAAILIGMLIFGNWVMETNYLSPFVIVPAGCVGVNDFWGSVDPTPLQPGFHLKNPLTNTVIFSTKTQSYDIIWTDLTKAPTITKDQMNVDVDATVLYHLQADKAPEVYSTVEGDYRDILVTNVVRSAIRSAVVRYGVADMYNENRFQFAKDIKDIAAQDLAPRGIVVEAVNLRSITPPKDYTDAVAAKMAASQKVEQKQYEIETAKKEAERIRIETDALVYRNTEIGKSLNQYSLSSQWIEAMSSQDKTIIYVPVGDDGMPLFKSV